MRYISIPKERIVSISTVERFIKRSGIINTTKLPTVIKITIKEKIPAPSPKKNMQNIKLIKNIQVAIYLLIFTLLFNHF